MLVIIEYSKRKLKRYLRIASLFSFLSWEFFLSLFFPSYWLCPVNIHEVTFSTYGKIHSQLWYGKHAPNDIDFTNKRTYTLRASMRSFIIPGAIYGELWPGNPFSFNHQCPTSLNLLIPKLTLGHHWLKRIKRIKFPGYRWNKWFFCTKPFPITNVQWPLTFWTPWSLGPWGASVWRSIIILGIYGYGPETISIESYGTM